jgi:IS30 family transposase
MALGKKITDNEKQMFVGLHKSGMGTPQIARITNRSESTIRRFTTGDEVIDDKPTYLMDEEMFLIFDNHTAGLSNVDIAIKLNRPQQTVSKVVRREYVKHENAYQRWLELQGQAEAPVTTVVPSALQAIRTAREAGRIATLKQEEESPALVMKVQTVEALKQDEPEQPGIDWQAKWCEAQQQIAELKEINSILKGYVRHLQRLSEQ